MNVTLIPTCEKNVYLCPETGVAYVMFMDKNNHYQYDKLTEFLEHKKDYYFDESVGTFRKNQGKKS